jgi:hypothetical protein
MEVSITEWPVGLTSQKMCEPEVEIPLLPLFCGRILCQHAFFFFFFSFFFYLFALALLSEDSVENFCSTQ